MRITKIEIKNFRAFCGAYQIDLHKAGKNLLIYGENGSGKTSLYQALKNFLESSDGEHQFKPHQNIFNSDAGYIKLHLRTDAQSKQDTYEWSETVKDETNDQLLINASRTKGFLDYKDLLETHYLHRENDVVNVLDLLVKTLLANTVSRETDRSLAEDWDSIQPPFPRRGATTQITALERQIENFNNELAGRLEILQVKTSEILRKFGYNIALDLNFHGLTYNKDNKTLDNQEILLKVKFFDRDIPEHHRFLNEAKLSAIAIAIYFSSILIQPESDLRILALDDVLIGLDMSNRLPVLDILEEYFEDYQIFLTTYDKAWYEIVKQRTSHGGKWKAVEFYFRQTDEYEIPVYAENKAYLDKAREYLEANDDKACAIYLRTAYEMIIEEFCESKQLPVKYRRDPNKQYTQDFWDAIKIENKKRIEHKNPALLAQKLIDDIELYRSRILNPLSHATITTIPKKEIEDTIEAVENLGTALG
ncbi:MAG: AAA family ATPase [Candidatus Poribacteria bacterium]|nr:AAA family ATPase [Candidatus Poribacteria bacterium]